jgi:hypothetical protein
VYSAWGNAVAPGTSGNALVIESLSSNSACYVVFDDQSLATPEVGYYVWKNGCPATLPATFGTGTPTTGSASAHVDAIAVPSFTTLATAGSLYSTF